MDPRLKTKNVGWVERFLRNPTGKLMLFVGFRKERSTQPTYYESMKSGLLKWILSHTDDSFFCWGRAEFVA